ncbi:hypothetical protein ACLB2K_021414 [Fragaria x ananassa]
MIRGKDDPPSQNIDVESSIFLASVSGAASPPIREINDAESLGKKNKTCDLPRLPVLPHTARPLSREKEMWLFSIQVGYMDKCERSETLKECNQMIKRCIQRAGIATNETGSATQMEAALIIFKSMKDWGLPLEEETYGPLLEYLIDKQMLDYFRNFLGVIGNENPSSCSRIRHYQKLFLSRQYDKLVQKQYDAFVSYDGDPKSLLPDCAAGNTSILIYRYVLGIPNLTYLFHCYKDDKAMARHHCVGLAAFGELYPQDVEDVMSKFKNLHRKLEVTPSSVSYEKLIIYCCDSLEVHVALELVDEMIELGMTCSLETLHSILQANTENCDFNLHSMPSDLDKMNLMPTGARYINAINAGYFREEKEYLPLLLAEKGIFQ